jgi:preprotein translocase subunit SecE
MHKLLSYLRETRNELNHVSWPTRKQTIIYTALVVVVSLLTAVYLGVFDALFAKGLTWALAR